MNLCKYNNILGIPNQGVHSYRIFNLAIFDIIATLVLGYIISIFTKYKLSNILVILFLLGIILHRVFCG